MRAPSLFAAAALLLALVTLAGCGGSPSTAPATTVPPTVGAAELAGVTLRVGDQNGDGIQALLQAAGLLSNVPYHIQWSTFTSGPSMVEAAGDNAIDVGQVGNTPPIFSAAAHGDIDVIGAFQSAVGDAVLVPRDSTLHTLADLRGRTIAVAQGSSANGTLLNTLRKAGLSPQDVRISYLQPADAYAALRQGSVAAWVVWQPYVSEAELNLGARPLVSGQDTRQGTGLAAGTTLSNGYAFEVASRAALGNAGKNTALADYLSRVGRAQQWAASHPDAWAAIYAQQSGIPVAVARAAMPDIVAQPVLLDNGVVASEQQLADAFATAGQIPGHVDFAAFIDPRFNAEVTALLAGR